jgi:hypothetical protein
MPAEVREQVVNVECPVCHRWHATPESKARLPCWWCRHGLKTSRYVDGVDRTVTIPRKEGGTP